MNPRPLAPKWFYDHLFHSTQEMDVITEGFVQRVWEGLMERGHHTQDPFFLNWELHLYSYSGKEYQPDRPDGR